MSARGPQAWVEPAVLAWLRGAAGYSVDEAARKIQTKPENLAAWEAGEQRPSMPQLRRLARAFKRPLSDFYLPRPMPEPPIPHDFRRIPDDPAHAYSPALRHELRLAYRRRSLALDFARELDLSVRPFRAHGRIRPSDNPETAGEGVRALLGVEIQEQTQWRDSRIGYNAWRRKIEALDVLVFQVASVEKAQMLGFSLAFDELPVIAVNRKLKPNGRTLTMLHEFAHLLLGEGGLCDPEEDLPRSPREQAVEVFCNHVAGAALVPRDALLAHRLVAPYPGVREWEEDALEALARSFCVSEIVIARRLQTVGYATSDFYRRFDRAYRARIARQEERESADDFKRNMPQEAVSNLGAFARLVMQSYMADAINITDAAKFLGVKAEKVERVGELLA